MKKKGSNTKIRKHMRRLSQRESGEWYMHTVRRLVDARPDKMHTIRSVADLLAASDTDHGERSETFKQTRSALYNLAADDRIAFVSRSFHAWDLGDEMKNTRCVFYGKSTPYRAPMTKRSRTMRSCGQMLKSTNAAKRSIRLLTQNVRYYDRFLMRTKRHF